MIIGFVNNKEGIELWDFSAFSDSLCHKTCKNMFPEKKIFFDRIIMK